MGSVLGWAGENDWVEAMNWKWDEIARLERDIKALIDRIDWAIRQEQIKREWDAEVDAMIAKRDKQ